MTEIEIISTQTQFDHIKGFVNTKLPSAQFRSIQIIGNEITSIISCNEEDVIKLRNLFKEMEIDKDAIKDSNEKEKNKEYLWKKIINKLWK